MICWYFYRFFKIRVISCEEKMGEDSYFGQARFLLNDLECKPIRFDELICLILCNLHCGSQFEFVDTVAKYRLFFDVKPCKTKIHNPNSCVSWLSDLFIPYKIK